MTMMHITILEPRHFGSYLSPARNNPINPQNQINTDWQTIADLLCTLHQEREKEAVPMFTLWQFKTLADQPAPGRKYDRDETGEKLDTYTEIPGTIRRCSENAVAVNGLVLDYDGNLTLADAIEHFQNFECVVYTTHQHMLPEKGERFRVVLPFDRPASKQEYLDKLASIKSFFPGVDNASFSVAQAIHMHSAALPEHAFAMHYTGAWLSPDNFETAQQKTVSTVPQAFLTDFDASKRSAYGRALLQALSTCSGVHRGAMTGNSGVLGLATLVKHAGGTQADFDALCLSICAYDSCARSTQSVRNEAWRSAKTSNATASFRDRWIAEHGGTDFQTILRQTQIDDRETWIANRFAQMRGSRK